MPQKLSILKIYLEYWDGKSNHTVDSTGSGREAVGIPATITFPGRPNPYRVA